MRQRMGTSRKTLLVESFPAPHSLIDEWDPLFASLVRAGLEPYHAG